jgi:glycosyltransferase involved in cell wall biosynthesis
MRILIIENDGNDFLSSRLPILRNLENRHDFYVCYPGSKNNLSGKIKYLDFSLDKKNKSFLQIYRLSKKISQITKTYDINLIHSYRFQPNLIAALAKTSKTKVIAHITGLGIAFSGISFLLKLLSLISYQYILIKADLIITQNYDDFNDINLLGKVFFKKNRIVLGSGIDITEFYPVKSTSTQQIIKILFVSRLLKSKGIIELVEAVQYINSRNKLGKNQVRVNLDIIGWVDYDNPDCLDQEYIDDNSNQEIIFHGKRNDLVEFYRNSDIFCLPTKYREGIPRVLLEALSCGLPIITSDSPGCRICVKENGYLLNHISREAIVESIDLFCQLNQSDREKMKINSRTLAYQLFSVNRVSNTLETIYKELS